MDGKQQKQWCIKVPQTIHKLTDIWLSPGDYGRPRIKAFVWCSSAWCWQPTQLKVRLIIPECLSCRLSCCAVNGSYDFRGLARLRQLQDDRPEEERLAVTQQLSLLSSLGLNFSLFICGWPKFLSGEEFGSALRLDIVHLTAETTQNLLFIFLWQHREF